VRWLPSPDPRAGGYEVYVRAGGQPYQGGIDAGSPPPDASGRMSFVVDGLGGGTHHFTVMAYQSDGSRSTCPGELILGATDPCVVDQCCLGNCYFEVFPDGEPCAGDVCSVCRAGACTGATESTLGTDVLRLAARKNTDARMTARGSLVPPAGFDPSQSGLTLGVTDPSGAVFAAIAVPPGAMRRASSSSFVLDRNAGVVGVRALSMRSVQGRTRVMARVDRSTLNAALAQSSVAWAVRVGDDCARSNDLVCTGPEKKHVCR
jgi:hypothetical protein